MAQNSDEVVVAGAGDIWVAAVGVAPPDDSTTAPGTGWTNLGFADEDGVTLSFGKDTDDVTAWQSFDPIRKLVTGRAITAAFNLLQWNPDTITLAMGGGEYDDGKFEPAPASALDLRALMVDGIDGENHYRWIFYRAMVSEAVELQYTRSAAAPLPITMAVLAADPVYTLLTDAWDDADNGSSNGLGHDEAA